MSELSFLNGLESHRKPFKVNTYSTIIFVIILIVYITGECKCECMSSVEITPGMTGIPTEPSYYPCKFPFTYQGQKYHKCRIGAADDNFCAIDAQGDDGDECPGCWKNETYKVGWCGGDWSGICYTDTPAPGGKYKCNDCTCSRLISGYSGRQCKLLQYLSSLISILNQLTLDVIFGKFQKF